MPLFYVRNDLQITHQTMCPIKKYLSVRGNLQFTFSNNVSSIVYVFLISSTLTLQKISLSKCMVMIEIHVNIHNWSEIIQNLWKTKWSMFTLNWTLSSWPSWTSYPKSSSFDMSICWVLHKCFVLTCQYVGYHTSVLCCIWRVEQ